MITVCAPSHPLARVTGHVPLDELTRFAQLVVTDNQADAKKSQRSVAGERNWFVDDLNTKHDFLRAGLGWGHMPVELVAADLAAGVLVEIERRAWHFGPVSFMISRLRGHEPSQCEMQMIELLAGEHRNSTVHKGRWAERQRAPRRRKADGRVPMVDRQSVADFCVVPIEQVFNLREIAGTCLHARKRQSLCRNVGKFYVVSVQRGDARSAR